jgi:hypothetical protein
MRMRWFSAALAAATLSLLFGAAAVRAQDEATIKSGLQKLVGDKGPWKAAVFAALKKGMSCDDLKKVYADLEGCDPAQEWSFAHANAKDDALVAGYQFSLNSGKLSDATVMFKGSLDKEVFKKASLEVFQAKWGELKEGQAEDILTWVNSEFNTTQRNYMVDHWELKNDLPENE